ncbi:MAG: hypothetical protein QOI34_1777 [Verrucomicrobiota bacterium]
MKYLLNPWYAHVADMILLGLRTAAHRGQCGESRCLLRSRSDRSSPIMTQNVFSAHVLYFEAYEYEIQIVEDGVETLVE